MDKSLNTIIVALKKTIQQLAPKTTPLSFILVLGKANQGKTELLKQSMLHQVPCLEEEQVSIFYNAQGIILELSESWINQSKNLLAYSLKKINQAHKAIRISGLICCIDSSELLQVEPLNLYAYCKTHTNLFDRFIRALGYRVPITLMFTKLDALAGFCDFFQTEHAQDLANPLGFSLEHSYGSAKTLEQYQMQFNKMIEMLGQKIIQKLHPARSSTKRNLIREFPLQLASLKLPIQTLIKHLPSSCFPIHKILFTSARQGGQSIDKLNQKIKQEFALEVQDTFSQSNNYRAYFLEGAITDFQADTKQYKKQFSTEQKYTTLAGFVVLTLGLSLIGYHHLATTSLLDEASQQLLAYESNKNKTSALYHLSQAETQLGLIAHSLIPHPQLDALKTQMHSITKDKLHDNFVPDLVNILETILSNPAHSQLARYDALKIYIMLNEPKHYSEKEVVRWFNAYWKNSQSTTLTDQQKFLLLKTLKQPLQNQTINQRIIKDTRNFLNALPPAYLYYTLAKNQFPTEKTAIKIEGFNLKTEEIPRYYTKEGFQNMLSLLPAFAEQLKQENWVLARQDLDNLAPLLIEAYCFDYMNWWKNFIVQSKPYHYQSLAEAKKTNQELYQNKSLIHLIEFIQKNTSPEGNNLDPIFNQKIANQFTAINLLTDTATQELNETINELEKMLTTLSLIDDKGKAVFDLTSARFSNNSTADPISLLYAKSRQLPEPLNLWAKQIADESWTLLINQSRAYLNTQWEQAIFQDYEKAIAKRYPFDSSQLDEVSLTDFNTFFAPTGKLNLFVKNYLKPFLDTTDPQWKAKEVNGFIMPISSDMINELIRANVISNMFFPNNADKSTIDFSLQKINLDPVVSHFKLSIGSTTITDSQNTENNADFTWPSENATLSLDSIEGQHYDLEEKGLWAFFKILQKVNVLADNDDSSSLQILFEVNGNSGRYLLKTQNQINPFSPGVLSGFKLTKTIA